MQQEKLTPAIASKWFNAREWANGLKLAAHKSTDELEFYFQYHKNKECWDQAFAFLRDTNLETIAAGKHKIDAERVYVIVSDDSTKNIDETKWEAHIGYIDIQYVALGKERIGVAPLSKAVAIEPFNYEKDLGFFEVPDPDCRYYTAEPGTFFVFFPRDAHRPSIGIKGTGRHRKIVIKIKVV